MSNKEFDQDKELLALHEKYQAVSTEVPPDSIDVSIINAAHSAVSSQPNINNDISSAQLNKKNKHAWYVPVSYVAIVVLSLSVFMKLLFESEQLQPELNGADFSEETFLPDISGRSADELHISTDESKETGVNSQQQLVHSEKERFDESLRQKKKATAQSKQRMLLKQQVGSSTPSKTAPARSEVLNDSAGVAAKAVSPIARMSSPPRVQTAEPDLQSYSIPPSEKHSAPATGIEPVIEPATAPVMPSVMPSVIAPATTVDLESYSGSASEQIMGAIEQRSDTGQSNEDQLEQINKLVVLFNTKQLDKLKLELALYRKNYPYNKDADLLPKAIREQEIRWQIEDRAKSLHN